MVKPYKNTQNTMLFSSPYMDRKSRKSVFLNQVNKIVDWSQIEKELEKVCKRSHCDAAGQRAYAPVLLFKMMLLQTFYNLSDEGVEDLVKDSLSAMYFCGLVLEDSIPDHSTLSRFRSELTAKKAMNRLLKKVNQSLSKHRLILNKGKVIVVDASLSESPFSPKGIPTYEIAQDRREGDRAEQEQQKEFEYHSLKAVQQPGADHQARWLKKANRCVYGYKRHDAVDEQGLILATHTTTANEHDSKGLADVLEQLGELEEHQGIYTDKGYRSADNHKLIRKHKAKNRMQYKAYRNKPLTERQKQFNKAVSRCRYVVERSFGGMKKWFGAGRARYKGLAKMHTQHLMEAIAYNLKRAPGLVHDMA